MSDIARTQHTSARSSAAASAQPVASAPAIVRQPTAEAQERRDLNHLVHSVLIVGLAVSATLMVIGVVLGLVEHTALPTSTVRIGILLGQVMGLEPSGFLNLGLLVLILTPMVRVIGSMLVFLYQRDWRYAGITAVVLIIMLISVITGHSG